MGQGLLEGITCLWYSCKEQEHHLDGLEMLELHLQEPRQPCYLDEDS